MNNNSYQIQVAVRLRPFVQNEDDKCVSYFSNEKIIISKSDHIQQQYSFESTYDAYVDQESIFLAVVMPLIQDALLGLSSNLLLYGGQASGKSYTLIGTEASLFTLKTNLISVDAGIVVRTINFMLPHIQEVKIYKLDNEQINIMLQCNLIGTWNQMVKVLIDPLEKLLKTNGHIIIEIKTKYTSRIRFIQTSALSKIQNNQSNNKSIFALHRCLSCVLELQKHKKLGNNKLYIPFRESKLTSIIADSFQGMAELKLLLCLAPVNYDDCLSTLNFGQQFQQVQLQRLQKAEILKVKSLESSQMLIQQSLSCKYQFKYIFSVQQQETIPLVVHRQKMQEVIDKYEYIIEYLQNKLIKHQ